MQVKLQLFLLVLAVPSLFLLTPEALHAICHHALGCHVSNRVYYHAPHGRPML